MAGSPIRHENAVQGSAVEVQTYQPPWKALSEFALQSDLDQPAFQQLVRPCADCTVGVVWRGLHSYRTRVLGTDLVMRKPAEPATSLLTLTGSQSPCAGGDLPSLSSGFTQLTACLQGIRRVSEQVTQEQKLERVFTFSFLVSLPSQVSFSESGSLGNSSGSDVTSLSSQLPDTPNSMVPSPVET